MIIAVELNKRISSLNSFSKRLSKRIEIITFRFLVLTFFISFFPFACFEICMVYAKGNGGISFLSFSQSVFFFVFFHFVFLFVFMSIGGNFIQTDRFLLQKKKILMVFHKYLLHGLGESEEKKNKRTKIRNRHERQKNIRKASKKARNIK